MCPFDDDPPEQVKPKAISLWYEHQSLLKEHETLRARIAELEQQVAKKNKHIFGQRSERTRPDPSAAAGDHAAREPE